MEKTNDEIKNELIILLLISNFLSVFSLFIKWYSYIQLDLVNNSQISSLEFIPLLYSSFQNDLISLIKYQTIIILLISLLNLIYLIRKIILNKINKVRIENRNSKFYIFLYILSFDGFLTIFIFFQFVYFCVSNNFAVPYLVIVDNGIQYKYSMEFGILIFIISGMIKLSSYFIIKSDMILFQNYQLTNKLETDFFILDTNYLKYSEMILNKYKINKGDENFGIN